MANRRSLTEGMNSASSLVDAAKEHEFIFGQKKAVAEVAKPVPSAANISRTQLSSRIRTEYFDALKLASLQRQIEGRNPYTITEILEEAIGPWLKSNGHLP